MGAEIVYRVFKSKLHDKRYGVFKVYVYDDAPPRVDEEMASASSEAEAARIADKMNSASS